MNRVCNACGMVEPDFWWLDDYINPSIREELKTNRVIHAYQFYPSLHAAMYAWGQTEEQLNAAEIQNPLQ